MSDAGAPQPSYRLIPSRFPPVNAFETVATAGDLAAVMDLSGWTNDRLVRERLGRLPQSEWVYGRPNASVVMASFLHVAPGGMRFNGSDLGAWYAAATVTTAIVEVAHHLRREAAATGSAGLMRTCRTYGSAIGGMFVDLRGQAAALPHLYDPRSYAGSQPFGEGIRASGGHGIIYDSIRHAGGTNAVAYRTHDIQSVVQADHYEVAVKAADRMISARKITP